MLCKKLEISYERVHKLQSDYGDILYRVDLYYVMYCWVSVIENMLIHLEVVLSCDVFSKIRFIGLRKESGFVVFFWGKSEIINADENEKTIKIISFYESMAQVNCDRCQ